jgi:nucleoside-diphosphate-sugar epimerase
VNPSGSLRRSAERKSLVVTGARGVIGSILSRELRSSYDVVGIDVKRGWRDTVKANATDREALEREFQQKQLVIDLAAKASPSTSWDEVLTNNVPSTLNVLEASRRAHVERVVFASSNRVTGMYERDHPYAAIAAGAYEGLDPTAIPRITAGQPIRPDSPYAVGKALGEAAASYYSDQFGLSVICLRLGTVTRTDRPQKPRDFATLLTHRDLVALVTCCLEAPADVRFATLYGVSANTWCFWDIETARGLVGYEPRDNAERWR